MVKLKHALSNFFLKILFLHLFYVKNRHKLYKINLCLQIIKEDILFVMLRVYSIYYLFDIPHIYLIHKYFL